MVKVTLLTEEQIWGSEALEVIKSYGTKVAPTDLAIVLGGWLGSAGCTLEGDRSGYIWTASGLLDLGLVRTITHAGDKCYYYPNRRRDGIRPVLLKQETDKIKDVEYRYIELTNEISVKVAFYGEYPQKSVKIKLSELLEEMYHNKELKKTKRFFTFDTAGLTDYETGLKPKKYFVYEHGGKKYIRLEGRPADSDSILSNGKDVQMGDSYWLEVLPIEWLVDEGTGIWISKKALVSGVRFGKDDTYNGKFNKTDMYAYLNNYFAKEFLAK
ncbi:MAG: hypothetical protein IJY92_03220 [Alphaproteobacteria bacterium]|nr:hypothetical protein [Alphaproteobacteria bacterium]